MNMLKKRILTAGKKEPADLILKGGKVVNVFSGRINRTDVALSGGTIAGLGNYENGKEVVDITGKWVVPGLIDGHFHIESSMMGPTELSSALLVNGTTAIVSDPHEIANVMGIEGIELLIREARKIPFDIFFTAPSCVPATNLETAGARLDASELSELKKEELVVGLAEVMNFPGVINCNDDLLRKIMLFRKMPIDGHCPGLTGAALQSYIASGIYSDHETISYDEALEKLESGMMIMIREGTSARNLEALLPLVDESNERRFCIVSDDLHPNDIRARGHLNYCLKKAMEKGLDAISAVRMATLNPAEYFGLKYRGAIAPGFIGDLTILDDLMNFTVSSVYKNGRIIVEKGSVTGFTGKKETDRPYRRPLNMAPFGRDSFLIPHKGGKARVIEIIPGQIFTRLVMREVKSEKGYVIQDVSSDILKLCVVERHKATGNIGLGLVKGFGLKEGALASSVAHDSHNVIVVGVSDHDIYCAVKAVRDMGGGLVVVSGGRPVAKTPLEIGGLMSEEPLDVLLRQLECLKRAAGALGCRIKEPFMTLSFLALPVIPELKLSDLGYIDVNRFEIVDLFTGD